MNEFLQTINPVSPAFYIAFLTVALLYTLYFAYRQGITGYDAGFTSGRSDLDSLIVKAESSGYRKGYLEGKDAGIFMGKSHAQKAGNNTPKTPVKQPPKPSNNRRAQAGQNKPKPAAKKPVKRATKGK